MEVIDGATVVLGRVRGYRVTQPLIGLKSRNVDRGDRPGYWEPTTPWRGNRVVFEWASVVGSLLTRRGLQYGISGMYLEFENVASPGDIVTVPSLDRTYSVAYYNALSGNRDYLRVQLTAATLGTSDSSRYPNGNQPLFFARSQGLQGVHGLPFDSSHNSVIYGAALIAQVNETDATQDLVFSSFYFDEDEQQPKLSTSQVGIEWELTLQ